MCDAPHMLSLMAPVNVFLAAPNESAADISSAPNKSPIFSMVVSLAFCELTATDTMMRKMGAAIHHDAFRTGNVVNNGPFPFIIDYAPRPAFGFLRREPRTAAGFSLSVCTGTRVTKIAAGRMA